MPKAELKSSALVGAILRTPRFNPPRCEPADCHGVKQYRSLTAEGLLLL